MADMLADFDIYEVGKQYCVFDSDLLRFKPDYSKLSVADFDDYAKAAVIICIWGNVGANSGDWTIQINRIKKEFRIRMFTRFPHTYDKKKDFYDSKNYKYFENLISLLNIRYKLIQLDEVRKLKNEYDKDVGYKLGTDRWWESEHRIALVIEYVETMDNISTKTRFGSDKTRRHFHGILTSLMPWSAFLNSGICG